MSPKELEKINKTIEDTIKKVVNGKIDRLQAGQDERKKEFDEYVREDIAWKKNDIEWKDNVTPSIEIMKKIEGFSSTSTYILKTIVLLSAGAGAVWAFIKFIRN